MKRIEVYKKRKRGEKRGGLWWKILAFVASCATFFFICLIAGAFDKAVQITVEAVDIDILQGEELPALQARVTVEGNEDAVLEREPRYTVKELVKELKDQSQVELTSDADPAVEGTYSVHASLHKKLEEKLREEWEDRVQIHVKGGKVTVKNPVGYWQNRQFKRYDGTYVTEDFVVSRGNTYYFDQNSNKVTGWQTIAGATYCFNSSGVMQTGWQKKDNDYYFMGENGAALVGWQDLGGVTYYFLEDGRMATGEIHIGLTQCVFDENGKLVSKTESTIDPNKPMVALTFDDGPGKRTGELLNQLEKYNAHATFFMLGQKISSYQAEVRRMKEIGCELGNHSYDHKDLAKLDAAGVKGQVDSTNNKINEATGSGATVMRPPYGSIGGAMREQVGMPMILWNIDTLDWKTRDAKATVDQVMGKAKDGDIILMHDIHSETIDAALELIPKLQEAGFQLVTVSELAAAKGITLESGQKYTDF